MTDRHWIGRCAGKCVGKCAGKDVLEITGMDSSEKSYDGDLIGVDVGGTFTDLVRLDQTSGAARLAKVASTLDNQAFGVMLSLIHI